MPKFNNPKNVVSNISKIVDAQQKRLDYWKNESTGIGTTYDRNFQNYQASRARFTDQELQAFYIDNDIAATIIDRVPEEGIRQGYELVYEGMKAGEGEDIVKWAEEKYGVAGHVLQGAKWARLFGGAGTFIGLDNGEELIEPAEADIYPIEFLRTMPRVDMQTSVWYDDEDDVLTDKFGHPAVYRVTMRSGGAGVAISEIHQSRFHIYQGVLTTQQRYLENDGWGDSVLTRVIDILKRFDGSWISVMHLLTDSSVPVYKIRDLIALLESDQTEALLARLQLIDNQKNNMRPIVLDAEAEEYERVPAEFTDVSSILQMTMIRMSGAGRLPVSILFGQAPAGLNASPEGDLRNFYDSVDVHRKRVYKPALLHLYKFLLAQKDSPTKGRVPENMDIEFPSLWQADPVQAATLLQMMATADGTYIANSVMDPAEVAVHRSKTARSFGFPALDVESRKEFLELLNHPEAMVASPQGSSTVPGGKNLPSNAIMPLSKKGGEGTGAPSGFEVTNEPQKASLTGAQIKTLMDLAKEVSQGLLPKSSAKAIALTSFPITEEAAESIFEGIDDVYAESSEEERAEIQARPFGGLHPGNDGKSEGEEEGEEANLEEEKNPEETKAFPPEAEDEEQEK